MSAFVQPVGSGKNKIFELYRYSSSSPKTFKSDEIICSVELPNLSSYNNLYVIWRHSDSYEKSTIIPVSEIANQDSSEPVLYSNWGDAIGLGMRLVGNTLEFYAFGGTGETMRVYGKSSVADNKLIGTVFFLA